MAAIRDQDPPDAACANLTAPTASRPETAENGSTGFGDLLVGIGKQIHAHWGVEGQGVTDADVDALFKRA